MNTETVPQLQLKERPSLAALKIESKAFFDQRYAERGEVYNEAQGLINLLRHRYSNYDHIRHVCRKGIPDSDPIITALKIKVIDLIVDFYPQLRTEGVRQKDSAESRAARHAYSARQY